MIRILLGIVLMGVSFVLMFMLIGDPEDNDLIQQVQSTINCRPGETFTQELGEYIDNFGTDSDGLELTFYCENERGVQRDVTGGGVLTIAVGFAAPFILGLLLMLWGIFAMVWKATRKLTDAAMSSASGAYGQNTPFGQSGVQPSTQYTNMTGQPRQTSTSFVDVNGQPVDPSSLTPEQLQKVQQALSSLGMNMPITGVTGTTVTTSSVSSGFGTGSVNTGADLVAQLQQLEEARNKSLITQEEYDRMRKEILDRLA